MTRAVLYARVSSNRQQKEGTIESQVHELRRQIAAAARVLVKEYLDDGHTGTELVRPGLDELRKDLKTDVFDAVYFLCADRIARTVIHQNIIIAELVHHKKRIIINGQDYQNNPENNFTLTVFGAVAEFERAKIIERSMRGKLHRLRSGQLSSHGQFIYGYTYVRKTPEKLAALVINPEQAAVVREIFEKYAGGEGLVAIARSLETRGILTRHGKKL